MKKRFISAVMAIIMVLLIIPVFAVPASAATITVDTAEKLRQALMQDGDMDIILTKDITGYKLPNDFKWGGYDEEHDRLFWATVGKGTKNLVLQGHDVNIDDDFVTTAKYQEVKRFNTETGKEYEVKTLIKGLYVQNAALLRISSGTTLNIYGYGGGMAMTAQIPSKDQIYDNQIVMQRDIFFVDGGELNVEGGTYQAGRKKEIYVSNSIAKDTNWATEFLWGDYVIGDNKNYNGYGEYAINGVALRMYGGKATINGGTFKGHGYSYLNSEDTFFMKVYRNSVLSVYGGDLSIRDINVIGYCGSNVFYKGNSGSVDIYAGEFSTKAPDRFLWPNTNTSGVFGWAGYHSNYMSVDVKPGSVSIKGAVTHNKTSTTHYDTKTVVRPAESGFMGGKLTWSDGTMDNGTYTLGTKKEVVFTPGETYFPEGTLSGGQSVEYYYSIMVQKSDGKWISVGDSWKRGDPTDELSRLNDNWADGYNYSIWIKTVEYWSSESHSYQITTKAPKKLYFTVNTNKTISKVTVDGFSQSPAKVGPNTLTSSTTGVKSVSSLWYENGKAYGGTLTLTSGAYQACVTLTAADGYVFTKDTIISIYGVPGKPNYISSDGKTVQIDTPVINKPCDHSGNKNSWDYNTNSHFKYCSVCGEMISLASHTYSSGVSSGNLTTQTCTVCGYEKTSQNGKEAVKAILLDMPALVVGNSLTAPTLADEFKSKVSITSYQWYKGNGTTEKVSVGSKLTEGWYTIEITADVKNGYYFTNSAFVTHSHGTKAGSTSTDNTLKGTVNVYCSESATADIIIPSLTPDKTIGDVIKGIRVSRSGDERINVNYYINFDGTVYSVKRSFDGTYSLGSGASTLDRIFGMMIVPESTYEIEVELSVGKYYIDTSNITVDSKSFLVGYTTESNDAWGSAKATIISDTDIIDRVDIYAVEMPEPGITASESCSVYNDKLTLVNSCWNDSGIIKCGDFYVFSATVEPVNGYRIADSAVATVNGIEAEISFSGDTATVTFTTPVLEHSFSDWETVKEPTCTEAGTMRRKCEFCGDSEEAEIEATGHTLYDVEKIASTCVSHGVEEHRECSDCDALFSDFYGECTIEQIALPLDPSNHEYGPTECDSKEHYILCACGQKLEVGAHVFGEWVTVIEPEAGVKGLRNRTCDECGYNESEEIPALAGEHDHTFSLRYNENDHWEECKCGEKTQKENHKFNSDDVCTVCGYKKGSSGVAEPDNTTSTTETTTPGGNEQPGKKSLAWLWIIIAILVAGAAVAVIVVTVSKKKNAAANVSEQKPEEENNKPENDAE